LDELVRKELCKNNKKIAELPEKVLEFEDVWKNLTQPPLTPLTNYFYPTELEFNDSSMYVKNQYYVNISGDIKQNIEKFIDELICHRLSLDF